MTRIDLPDAAATLALVADLQAGMPDFARMLAHHGHAGPALRRLGHSHWREGRYDAAAQAFLAALSLLPEDADIWRDLANVEVAASHPEQALQAIDRSLHFFPRSAPSWLMLANLRDQEGKAEEAEAAYREAIALDPRAAAAHFGLGLLLFRQKRYEAALTHIGASVDLDGDNATAHYALGHLALIASEFGRSATAFDEAARLGMELDGPSRQKRARAATFQAMVEGRVQEALADYPALAGEDREDIEIIARDAFSILSAAGHLGPAAEVGRLRLAEQPDDPMRRYLLDAVSGRTMTAAPADYIEQYFDRFAPQFDRQLIENLQYSAPAQMTRMLARHRTAFARMLDLGCGTGLAAKGLSGFGAVLEGVDLSSGMLAEAAKRGLYSKLARADVVAYLEATSEPYDLIFAADVLIYLGELGPLLHAVVGALVPGGLFAVSIEVAHRDGYTLLPSGRFAHSLDYLTSKAADLAVLEIAEGTLRLEAGRPVPGLYVLMEKR